MSIWTGPGSPGPSSSRAEGVPERVESIMVAEAGGAAFGEVAGLEQEGVDKESDTDKRGLVMHLADTAQSQVYVCFAERWGSI